MGTLGDMVWAMVRITPGVALGSTPPGWPMERVEPGRTKPGIGLLAYGLPKPLAGICAVLPGGHLAARGVHWFHTRGALQRLGNAVVPQLAAEVLATLMED